MDTKTMLFSRAPSMTPAAGRPPVVSGNTRDLMLAAAEWVRVYQGKIKRVLDVQSKATDAGFAQTNRAKQAEDTQATLAAMAKASDRIQKLLTPATNLSPSSLSR
jgi:hypothetical protein